jgi:hypothetical protein
MNELCCASIAEREHNSERTPRRERDPDDARDELIDEEPWVDTVEEI